MARYFRRPIAVGYLRLFPQNSSLGRCRDSNAALGSSLSIEATMTALYFSLAISASMKCRSKSLPTAGEGMSRRASGSSSSFACRSRVAIDAARRFLRQGREAERQGRRDAAAEAYALYLLATPDTPSPQRADAARAVEELTGVHVVLRTGAERSAK